MGQAGQPAYTARLITALCGRDSSGHGPAPTTGTPSCLYDELANRWMASQFAINTSNGSYWQLVAVSATSDPLGEYYRYAFQMPAFNDYPKMAVWTDGYYATFQHVRKLYPGRCSCF